MKLSVLAAIGTLGVMFSGCAPTLVGSNQAGGVISNVGWHGFIVGLDNTGDAFAMANSQCQQYGKAAHIGNRITAADANLGAITFDCAPAASGETLSAAPQALWPETPTSNSHTPPREVAGVVETVNRR